MLTFLQITFFRKIDFLMSLKSCKSLESQYVGVFVIQRWQQGSQKPNLLSIPHFFVYFTAYFYRSNESSFVKYKFHANLIFTQHIFSRDPEVQEYKKVKKKKITTTRRTYFESRSNGYSVWLGDTGDDGTGIKVLQRFTRRISARKLHFSVSGYTCGAEMTYRGSQALERKRSVIWSGQFLDNP